MFTKSHQGKGIIHSQFSACEDPGKLGNKPVEPAKNMPPRPTSDPEVKKASKSMFDRASGNFIGAGA